MNLLVSILIPMYNAEKSIRATVDSCLQQSYQPIEIILVDDGSLDSTLAIARSYENDQIRVYSQVNKGASAARNRAFVESHGAYIQYLDADDLLDKRKIEIQMRALKNATQWSIASGVFQNFNQQLSDAKPIAYDAGYAHFDTGMAWLLLAAQKKAMFPPLVWLSPRKLIEAVGPWDENLSYNDDSEFFTRVLLKVDRIYYCADAKAYYRRGNPDSLGSRTDQSAKESEWHASKKIAAHLLAQNQDTHVKEAVAHIYARLHYSLYPDYKGIRAQIKNEIKQLNVSYRTNFATGKSAKLARLIGWKASKILKKVLKK